MFLNETPEQSIARAKIWGYKPAFEGKYQEKWYIILELTKIKIWLKKQHGIQIKVEFEKRVKQFKYRTVDNKGLRPLTGFFYDEYHLAVHSAINYWLTQHKTLS